MAEMAALGRGHLDRPDNEPQAVLVVLLQQPKGALSSSPVADSLPAVLAGYVVALLRWPRKFAAVSASCMHLLQLRLIDKQMGQSNTFF